MACGNDYRSYWREESGRGREGKKCKETFFSTNLHLFTPIGCLVYWRVAVESDYAAYTQIFRDIADDYCGPIWLGLLILEENENENEDESEIDNEKALLCLATRLYEKLLVWVFSQILIIFSFGIYLFSNNACACLRRKTMSKQSSSDIGGNEKFKKK